MCDNSLNFIMSEYMNLVIKENTIGWR